MKAVEFQRVKSMLLDSLDQASSIIINTIFGKEKAIVFLGKTFVDHQVYDNLNEAIAECKADLALGVEVLIAPDDTNHFRVWISIPEEMILQSA
ncbi:hypothetical protein ABRG53_2908 [Pseudanabaena sp. ABRG5-3]|jgi:hypothetical protein|nr:hypothetical protein ABRG53_2908 [Pseudanabaena sp. ABRG5-3]